MCERRALHTARALPSLNFCGSPNARCLQALLSAVQHPAGNALEYPALAQRRLSMRMTFATFPHKVK